MGHRQHPGKPYKPGGTNTPTSRKRKAASANAAVERARRRYRVVKFAREKIEELGINKRDAYALLRQAYQDPNDPFDVKPPAESTFYRWMQIPEKAGELSLGVFIEEARTGRPPKKLHPRIEQHLRTLIKIGIHPSTSSLWREVREFAEREGLPEPSEYLVRKYVDGVDPAEISAIQHGSKAAIADNLPKLTIPASYPHEVWALDEFEVPAYVRAWDPQARKYVSVKPMGMLVMDLRSRVVLAYRIFPPFQRGSATGYNAQDIIGGFLQAALHELASSYVESFVGFLPETVRMDNHPTHGELKLQLRKHGVNAANLRGRSPWANGVVEALVRNVKARSKARLPSAAHKLLPADRAREHPGATRTKAGASVTRVRRKIICAVEDLPTAAELEQQFGREVVARYHTTTHSDLGQRTPEDIYHSELRKTEVRSGRDAVYMMDARTVRVGKHFVVSGQKYAPEVNGRMLTVGEYVVCRPDPLRRGLWIEDGDRLHFVPPLDEYAYQIQPGLHVHTEHEKARAASDVAQEALEAHVEHALGAGAVERGRSAVATNRAGTSRKDSTSSSTARKTKEREKQESPRPREADKARSRERHTNPESSKASDTTSPPASTIERLGGRIKLVE